MAKQPNRFSRKFLTMLMLATALAIVILSQTGNPPGEQPRDSEQNSGQSQN